MFLHLGFTKNELPKHNSYWVKALKTGFKSLLSVNLVILEVIALFVSSLIDEASEYLTYKREKWKKSRKK